MVRGLVVDKKRGNILKVRLHYHKIGSGGLIFFCSEARRMLYDMELEILWKYASSLINSWSMQMGGQLQMDRHKYVKVAYHGFQRVSREERQATYGFTLSRDSYDEPDYALIDTLFSLAEAYLFMQLVDFRDQFPEKIPSGTEYDPSLRYLL
jgi:hypothetical protein